MRMNDSCTIAWGQGYIEKTLGLGLYISLLQDLVL